MDVLSRCNRPCINRLGACLLLVGILGTGKLTCAEEFDVVGDAPDASAPYIVFVAEESGFLRSGPGKEHYRTDSLRRGQELEVYVETATGWLGVRPPDESFCWMPADAVDRPDGAELGTIIEDKTVAWIGTHLGKARRYRWQVQLNAGEQVTIIGETERQDADGSKTWLRIVPPSGEFRWIHRDQVVESAEQLAATVAEAVAAGNDSQNEQVATVSELVPIDRNDANSGDDQDRNSGSSVLQNGRLGSPSDAQSSLSPTLAGGPSSDALQETDQIPDLRPLPLGTKSAGSKSETESGTEQNRPKVADRAIQFHRGVEVDDYRDSGAVIGSGLSEKWKDAEDALSAVAEGSPTSGRENLEDLPRSGAAAAASAIAEPLRRMTDVVANFISPPRLVEINSADANAFRSDAATAADRRWLVGSGTRQNSQTPLLPPATLARSGPIAGLYAPNQVIQTNAIVPPVASVNSVNRDSSSRIISVNQIIRVEDAVKGADLDTVSQILSRLLAERASADELDPLIRRIDSLLRSGDVTQATRTRELLERAQRYRNLAARRDGPTKIQSTVLATDTASPPLTRPLSTLNPIPASPQNNDSLPNPLSGTQSHTVGDADSSWKRNPTATPRTPISGSATGYLVQVYSSRANSPPFALTNDAGLTIAYVTPYPGVNLRNHLNSRIAVSGNEKMLQGMSTPHILVDRVIRR